MRQLFPKISLPKIQLPKIWFGVIVLVSLLGGILAWQFWLKKVTPLPTPVPVETPPPPVEETAPGGIIEDETANWKTYRNERWRYEIKYPKNWTAKESAQIVLISDVDKNNRIMVNTYPNYDSGVTLDGILSWVEVMKEVDCEGEIGPCSEIQIHKREEEGWIFQNRKIVKVMDKDAWQYIYENKLGDKISKIIYAAFSDSKGAQYIFEIELIDAVGDTSLITNQILSTFKFIE